MLQLGWVFGGVVGLLLGGVWTFGHASVYAIGFGTITLLLVVGLVQSYLVRSGRTMVPEARSATPPRARGRAARRPARRTAADSADPGTPIGSPGRHRPPPPSLPAVDARGAPPPPTQGGRRSMTRSLPYPAARRCARRGRRTAERLHRAAPDHHVLRRSGGGHASSPNCGAPSISAALTVTCPPDAQNTANDGALTMGTDQPCRSTCPARWPTRRGSSRTPTAMRPASCRPNAPT